MSFLSRLFGAKRPAGSPEDVEARLRRLEEEAERALPGYVGTAYNKAGDFALRKQRPERAVDFYGRAIDAFLEDAQPEAARGVANKIIRVRPTAVRTLCTLTWLDLAAGHQAVALLHLREYVHAANEAGQRVRAATQIYQMARLSGESEFVGAVADALDGLDFGNRAEEVRGWSVDGSPGRVDDDEALVEACLKGAIESNDPEQPLLSDEIGGSDESSGGEGAVNGEAEADSEREDRGEKPARKRRYRWD